MIYSSGVLLLLATAGGSAAFSTHARSSTSLSVGPFSISNAHTKISSNRCAASASCTCIRCHAGQSSNRLYAMGKTSVNEIQPSDQMVNVRFINTISGKDVVATVPIGANLLVVGDEAGVKLPRACRTGLCGSCTCELKDSQAIDGFATIRACSVNCFVPAGETEMVVDVYRMRQGQVGGAGVKGGKTAGAAPDAEVQYVSATSLHPDPLYYRYSSSSILIVDGSHGAILR